MKDCWKNTISIVGEDVKNIPWQNNINLVEEIFPTPPGKYLNPEWEEHREQILWGSHLDTLIEITDRGKQELEIQFDSLKSPPNKGVQYISRMYPNLMVFHYFHREDKNLLSKNVYHNGNLVEARVFDF